MKPALMNIYKINNWVKIEENWKAIRYEQKSGNTCYSDIHIKFLWSLIRKIGVWLQQRIYKLIYFFEGDTHPAISGGKGRIGRFLVRTGQLIEDKILTNYGFK